MWRTSLTDSKDHYLDGEILSQGNRLLFVRNTRTIP